MTAGPIRCYGAEDHRGLEVRNARLHLYASLAQLNADAGAADGRMAYCIETSRAYYGRPGAWVGLSIARVWEDVVATTAALPSGASNGQTHLVLDGDGSGHPGLFTWVGGTWQKIADPRIALIDGSTPFTALPIVNDPASHAPSADGHLTHKLFVDSSIASAVAVHAAATDPHGDRAYALAQDGMAIAAHNADLDPHTQYTTAVEAQTIADNAAQTAVASGLVGYATTGAVTAAINGHDTNPSAHAGIFVSVATLNAAIAAHDAAANPHATALLPLSHQTDPSAHAGVLATPADVSAAISAHNSDPAAHGGSSGPGSSASAPGVAANVFVVGAAHGQPVKAVNAGFVPVTTDADPPVGLCLKTSTHTSLTTGAVFSASAGTVTLASGSLSAGSLVRITGTVSNNGDFIVMAASGLVATLAGTLVDESVSATFDSYASDGTVVQSGGIFAIDSLQTHDFATSVTNPLKFYSDSTAAHGYDQSPRQWSTGYQMSASLFVVHIVEQQRMPFAVVTYAATTDLAFRSYEVFHTVSLTGNVIFTTSGRENGRRMAVRIVADGSARNLTWPAGWTWLNATPASLAANKTGVLTLSCFGANDSDIVAQWAVQP